MSLQRIDIKRPPRCFSKGRGDIGRMFEREAARLADLLDQWPAEALTPLVNLGSSTEHFRIWVQPWTDRLLFRPLRERGVAIVHVDVKAAVGVDLIADILTSGGYEQIKALQPRAVLLCNVLEHVLDPALLVRQALGVLEPGGRLIISVPRSYPHHRDPIDTMFRPTPADIQRLAPEASLTVGEIVATGYYWDDLKLRPWILLRQILRAPFPFLGWTRWKRSMKKLYWLAKPYLVTIVVLEKKMVITPAAASLASTPSIGAP
jgi:SAM-dependent methyltransferase